MFETVPPIPPPLGISQNVDENLPQLLDERGGSHVPDVPAFDKDDFTSWKVRFLVFLDGLEPYLLTTLEDGPFQPMSSLSTHKYSLPKRQNQWSNAESRLANQDKRLKIIIIGCLPNEGPSDTKDTKIAALRLKFNAFKPLEDEKVNGTFTNHSQRIDDLTKGKNEKWSEKGKGEKGLIAESFDWNDESVSLEDEDTTKIKAFMAIVEDEPSVRKADARSCQWVEITMKKDNSAKFRVFRVKQHQALSVFQCHPLSADTECTEDLEM
ncbi:hypothetical protein Tco_0917113 [Tanacetum coccineum]